jgi:ATP-dependent Clp protease adaptor protein ClpS
MTNPWNPEPTPLQPNPLVNPNPTTTTMVDNRPQLAPMYRVLLHNDDVNDMMHVVSALRQVFGFSPQQCIAIMLEAHNSGVALCKTEPMEHAELHQEQMQALSLTSTIEPEE